MYKEKLKEQLAELEKLQKNCAVERPEVSLAVSERILELAAVMDQKCDQHRRPLTGALMHNTSLRISAGFTALIC